jgi:hypothetical protein
LDSTKSSITFEILNVLIVDKLIGDLFFSPELDDDEDIDEDNIQESEAISKANAMKLFCETSEDDVRKYVVAIKNPLRFWLAIDHIKVGLSFRQAAAVMTQHRNRTKNVKLMGISDHMVGQYVRVLLAVALQLLSKVLTNASIMGLFAGGRCVDASRDALSRSTDSFECCADEFAFVTGAVF